MYPTNLRRLLGATVVLLQNNISTSVDMFASINNEYQSVNNLLLNSTGGGVEFLAIIGGPYSAHLVNISAIEGR